MSLKQSHEIECPRCENKKIIVGWDTINVQLDPEAKEALLDGKLHQFQCPSCGYEAHIEKRLLYHDMDKEFCVQFIPFQSIQEEYFYDEFTLDAKLDLSRTGAEDPSPDYFRNAHIVFSMDELIKYVIFRDKLTQTKKW